MVHAPWRSICPGLLPLGRRLVGLEPVLVREREKEASWSCLIGRKDFSESARSSRSFEVIFDLEAKERALTDLDKQIAHPQLWDNPDRAREVTRQRSEILRVLEPWRRLWEESEELTILMELAAQQDDPETEGEIQRRLKDLSQSVQDLEFRQALSGDYDPGNAIVTIHPGAGGTEAQDWAEMLLRMYLRWAERRGFKTEILDYLDGDEAGLKSVTFMLRGDYAYGYMRPEIGIHRLVRISPFDASKRRHTSFASVSVYPEVEDVKVEIDEKDLRVDTYRSSGAGGQHVNKTDSAVRITHLPTGIVVQCQNERSQQRNRATAMMILRARLFELLQIQQAEKLEELHDAKKEIAWGSQIRSYVLQPYRLVKDHRTNLEVGNVDAVLGGEIDPFIEAYLMRSTSAMQNAKWKV
jgi:peptide chain release factor 2